jgi:hypothetical protein
LLHANQLCLLDEKLGTLDEVFFFEWQKGSSFLAVFIVGSWEFVKLVEHVGECNAVGKIFTQV